ncbi:DNA methyltransferase [Microcystis aeruginosa]|uniref:DNA methyltransferase n=1 Tax=Microcystis aeruginosa TaxID=1126 RepID=UPI00232B8CD1|nr:DNA methyltransferase [Microcystis aeruginosa]MDB9393379.1 DNA methyltransferase [Microcystis aeruginosa CS-579]
MARVDPVFLAPDRFQVGKSFTYQNHSQITRKTFDYSSRLLLNPIEVKKRSAKRHFGVHGYFTKQAWNVVAEYIKNFSQPGDVILDPFGGSGVTAIEALMNNRQAISIDINPRAIFLVNSLITPVDFDDLSQAFERVKLAYQEREPQTKEEITKALNTYPYPQGLKLPKGSDVATVEQLFSNKQLAQLGLLKHLIKQELNENIRESLMLMFSGLLTKANLTYHTSKVATQDGQVNASAFQYYRYRIAPNPKDIDLITYFELRFKKI